MTSQPPSKMLRSPLFFLLLLPFAVAQNTTTPNATVTVTVSAIASSTPTPTTCPVCFNCNTQVRRGLLTHVRTVFHSHLFHRAAKTLVTARTVHVAVLMGSEAKIAPIRVSERLAVHAR